MLNITDIDYHGFRQAVMGMRNSFGSWDQSDSMANDMRFSGYDMGPKDMDLMKRLYKAGGSERKYLRAIVVWCDINAPLTWWKQFDTYKVGTVGLSTSTMHSITKYPFKITDFEYDKGNIRQVDHIKAEIEYLNKLRDEYLDSTDPVKKQRTWKEIIDDLPESYLQLRSVTMNYEVVAHTINDRMHHKLRDWHTYCYIMLDELPYLKEIMGIEQV